MASRVLTSTNKGLIIKKQGRERVRGCAEGNREWKGCLKANPLDTWASERVLGQEMKKNGEKMEKLCGRRNS